MKLTPKEIKRVYDCDTGTALSIEETTPAIAAIETAPNLESAMENLRMLTVSKYALEQADNFREQSCKFAMLEAAALCRVVELGGSKDIKPMRRRKAAEWIASLSAEERSEVVSMCFDGMTIEHIWQREIENPRLAEKGIASAKQYESTVMDMYEQTGIVSLSDFDKKLDKLPADSMIVNGIKDEMRKKLRKAGAVGVGDDDGTYINPSNTSRLGEAIEIRINSLQSDILRLIKLVEMNDEEKPTLFIDAVHNHTTEMPVGDYIACALAMCGVVKVRTTTEKKAAQIIERFISHTFPDYLGGMYVINAIYEYCMRETFEGDIRNLTYLRDSLTKLIQSYEAHTVGVQ